MSIDNLARPEKYQHKGHRIEVIRYYSNGLGKTNGAVATIDGHEAQLILNKHGELDTWPLGAVKPDSGELIRSWSDTGLIKSVYRGFSIEPDDAEAWQGPIPERLRGLVRR